MHVVSVIIPTYRRPKDLERCLRSLKQQSLPPLEVIVVLRESDLDTINLIQSGPFTLEFKDLALAFIYISVPGVVAAMNLGLKQAKGEIVAFTDDDASPSSSWLEQISNHFQADHSIGGVGGRDRLQNPNSWDLGTRRVVGILRWYGKLVGEHHRGIGEAREVDILKGVNMAFRQKSIENLWFDGRMLGTGAQVHFEAAFCLSLRRKGWKLIYDPSITVKHYTATRFDEDQRRLFNETAFFNEIYNETLVIIEHLGFIQRLFFLIWVNTVGTRRSLGLMQYVRYLLKSEPFAWKKLKIANYARYKAWKSWRKGLETSRRSD
jgi:glycosyltransferase involved in cell wall biosynthesis